MKKDILEYYQSMGFDLIKIINRRPTNIMPMQVQAAAIKVFDDIKAGEMIKPINIPRRIYREAETIQYADLERDVDIMEHAKTYIASLKREIIITMIGFGIMTVIALYGVIQWLYL